MNENVELIILMIGGLYMMWNGWIMVMHNNDNSGVTLFLFGAWCVIFFFSYFISLNLLPLFFQFIFDNIIN